MEDKILVDRKELEQLREAFKMMKEYLQKNDDELYDLVKAAYKGLMKALTYFSSKNPELLCAPEEVSTNLVPDLEIADSDYLGSLLNGTIWIEDGDGNTIFESEAIKETDDSEDRMSRLKYYLTILADPANYCFRTLNPDFFRDYNFVEVYDDWKNNYMLPSEFEDVIDLLPEDAGIMLTDGRPESTEQLIVYR